MTIRVILADDHPVVRSGIRNELERAEDIRVVGEASNGEEAIALVKKYAPDVLLIDIYMPGMKTRKVIQHIGTMQPAPYVAVLTAHADMESVMGMLKAGATGYILKDEAAKNIILGLRSIAAGGIWFSAAVTQTLVAYHVIGEVKLAEELLSHRELQVLELMSRGLSNPSIAEQLNIAEGTVKNHISHIYTRLGVRTRVEAVVWAWENGVVKRQ